MGESFVEAMGPEVGLEACVVPRQEEGREEGLANRGMCGAGDTAYGPRTESGSAPGMGKTLLLPS